MWLQAVQLKRQVGHEDDALTLLDKALKKFPDFAKFWLAKADVLYDSGKIQEARKTLEDALQQS